MPFAPDLPEPLGHDYSGRSIGRKARTLEEARERATLEAEMAGLEREFQRLLWRDAVPPAIGHSSSGSGAG